MYFILILLSYMAVAGPFGDRNSFSRNSGLAELIPV
jgi:hypothetical protein